MELCLWLYSLLKAPTLKCSTVFHSKTNILRWYGNWRKTGQGLKIESGLSYDLSGDSPSSPEPTTSSGRKRIESWTMVWTPRYVSCHVTRWQNHWVHLISVSQTSMFCRNVCPLRRKKWVFRVRFYFSWLFVPTLISVFVCAAFGLSRTFVPKRQRESFLGRGRCICLDRNLFSTKHCSMFTPRMNSIVNELLSSGIVP